MTSPRLPPVAHFAAGKLTLNAMVSAAPGPYCMDDRRETAHETNAGALEAGMILGLPDLPVSLIGIDTLADDALVPAFEPSLSFQHLMVVLCAAPLLRFGVAALAGAVAVVAAAVAIEVGAVGLADATRGGGALAIGVAVVVSVAVALGGAVALSLGAAVGGGATTADELALADGSVAALTVASALADLRFTGAPSGSSSGSGGLFCMSNTPATAATASAPATTPPIAKPRDFGFAGACGSSVLLAMMGECATEAASGEAEAIGAPGAAEGASEWGAAEGGAAAGIAPGDIAPAVMTTVAPPRRAAVPAVMAGAAALELASAAASLELADAPVLAPATASANEVASSRAVATRRSSWGQSTRAIHASTAAGSPRRRCDGGTKRPAEAAIPIAVIVSPWKGNVPVSAAYTTTPSDHRSDRPSIERGERNCSGLM